MIIKLIILKQLILQIYLDKTIFEWSTKICIRFFIILEFFYDIDWYIIAIRFCTVKFNFIQSDIVWLKCQHFVVFLLYCESIYFCYILYGILFTCHLSISTIEYLKSHLNFTFSSCLIFHLILPWIFERDVVTSCIIMHKLFKSFL